MTDVVFKSPKVKKPPSPEDCEMDHHDNTHSPKKRRTAEDFFTFCNYILEYENYEAQKQEEVRAKSSSPLGSTGDSIKSESLSSASSTEGRKVRDLDSVASSGRRLSCLAIHENGAGKFDDDSWDLVTCYCMKPFAGRPMIECSDCLTWVHLSCAKIRKSNIPEEFTCQRCKEAKLITRRSQRNRSEKRRTSSGFKGSRKRKWRSFPPFPKSGVTSDL